MLDERSSAALRIRVEDSESLPEITRSTQKVAHDISALQQLLPRAKAHATSLRTFAQTEKSCRMSFCECAFVRKSFRFRSIRESITYRVDREEAATTRYAAGMVPGDRTSRQCTRNGALAPGHRPECPCRIQNPLNSRSRCIYGSTVCSLTVDWYFRLHDRTDFNCVQSSQYSRQQCIASYTNKLPFMYQIH